MTEPANLSLWWEQQNFPGKELFQLNENGEIILIPTELVKERTIATLTAENSETALNNLREKFETAVMSKVREMEVEWLAAADKNKLAEKVAQLKGTINATVAIGDFEKAARMVKDWETTLSKSSEEHTATKRSLAEQAEALIESTDWKETTQAFKDIVEKWRAAGLPERSRNDAYWSRIEKARDSFLDRKRAHQEDETKDQLVALDHKIELAEEAEALANSEDWKAATEAFHNIIEKWKTLGRTMPKKNEELWQRIMTAKNTFFDRKKAHFSNIQQEQEINLGIKLALADRAEALKESTDWNKTAQAMTALMDEWKKTGRVPQERSEEIWKRFSDAQEYFFEARRKHTDEMRQTMERNYELKSALLKQAEELKDSNRWSDTTAEMTRLMDEWKTIGPVPREHNNTLWDAFMAARKHFFDRKDASREQRKQQIEADKAHREAREKADKEARQARDEADRKNRIVNAKKTIEDVHNELAEEKEKLADFKIAIENIAPGKKAEELRKHLTQLISQSENHLAFLEQKIVRVTEEMNKVIEREESKVSQ